MYIKGLVEELKVKLAVPDDTRPRDFDLLTRHLDNRLREKEAEVPYLLPPLL